MKKVLLAMCGLLLSLVMTAAELNIYATGLKASVDNNVAQISYVLNAPASALELQLLNNDGSVMTALPLTDASYLTKGEHQILVPMTGITPGTWAWAIKASAAATTELALVTGSQEQFIFYSPRGVEVDNNPQSPFFGNIYVANSYKGADDGMTPTSKTQPEGIFFYNAALNLKNTNNQSYKGGVSWNAAGWGPYNMAIDAEGKVFICDNKDASTGVWMMDPANPENAFAEVLDVTKRGTNFTCINSMAVMGAGALRVLYAIDGPKAVVAFPIGTAATPCAATPDTIIDNLAGLNILNGRNHLVNDGKGGWWINQWRGQKDAYPYLIHINNLGVKDYEMSANSNADIAPATHQRGGFAINAEGNKIILSGNKTLNLFDVTYDAQTGAPTLTPSTVTFPTIGNNIDGVAFDLVGNVYCACASTELFYAFAMPKADNSFVTPAPATSTITVTDETPVFFDELISFTEAVDKGAWSNGAILPNAEAPFQIKLTDSKTKIAIDANTSKFNTGKGIAQYDFRMKTGGKSSASENFITVTFPADGFFTMCVRTGSNADATRTVNLIQGDTLYSQAPNEADLVYVNIEGNKTAVYPMAIVAVKKGTARLDYPVNGVNFYALGFSTNEPKPAALTPWVSVESVSLDKHEIANLEVGDTKALVATVLPANADKKTCQWSVTDETIATVANGVVTAVAPGETMVYVTTDDGNLQDSCLVQVIAKKYWYPNIYAYALAMRPADNIEPNHYLVEYTLNAPATEVNLLLLNTAVNCICYDTIALTGLALGKNAEDVRIDLEAGVYVWSIEAKAELASDEEAVQANVYDLTSFVTPRGVAVNSNPLSPYFGNIYVTESANGVAEGSGFKAYNALLETTDVIYPGAWSAGLASPMRITIGQDDDMLYISDWSDNTPNIHIVDPANLSNETLVFAGDTVLKSGMTLNAAGDTINGSMSSCYVIGKGANRQLFTFDEDMSTGIYPMGMFRYDIGELATPWTARPSAVVYDNADHFEQNGNSVIIPDAFGGWWISQDRATDSQAIPALIHINAEGTVDFNSAGMLGGRTRGAMAFNADQSVMVSASDNSLRVWDVTFDENHAPSVEFNYSIPTTFGAQTSSTCYAIGIDYAGNIYATGNGKPLTVWAAVKDENKAVTPGVGTIEVVATGLQEIPTLDNNAGARKVVIDGQVYIIRNGKMYNMIGATL